MLSKQDLKNEKVLAVVAAYDLEAKFCKTHMILLEQDTREVIIDVSYDESPRIAGAKRLAIGRKCFATDTSIMGQVLETLMNRPEVEPYL